MATGVIANAFFFLAYRPPVDNLIGAFVVLLIATVWHAVSFPNHFQQLASTIFVAVQGIGIILYGVFMALFPYRLF